ncbi:MAG: hypothetical protein AB2421_00155 [Thermotaleaceae bacterium]
METNRNNDYFQIYKLFLVFIIFTVVVISLLQSQSGMLQHLEMETYYKIQSSMEKYNQEPDAIDEEMKKIIGDYQRKREEIEKTTILNGIKGLLITVAIILATLSNIIKNFKSIFTELVGKYKNGSKSNGENSNSSKEESETICLIPMPKDKDWYISKEIRSLLEQLNLLEKNKLSLEMQQLIQQTVTMLIRQLMQLSQQTSSFTEQLNQDRQTIISGLNEIKKGIEQMTLVLDKKKNTNIQQADEEVIVAVEQINIVIEEIVSLLSGMEGKIQSLSHRIQNQEEHN